MLNDVSFLQQSLNNNLFYLRTIREFCANIQLSFFNNNKNYIDQAEMYAKQCEALGEILMKHANKNLTDYALDSQIFVTNYTLDCELLTEKLFGIDINTDITKQEMALTPGVTEEPSPATLEEIMDVNRRAAQLAINFINFCLEIKSKLTTNALFSYSYPALYDYMIEEAELYLRNLNRLIDKDLIDPTFVMDYEYWFNVSMRNSARFIRSFVNATNQSVFNQAQLFVKEFDELIVEYDNTVISPDNQQTLNAKSINLVNRYREFLRNVIEDVLNAKLYFIVEPIFLDNMYTEANYFKYILTKTIESNQ